MKDFMKALEEAQKLPDLTDNESPIPDLLKGADFDKAVRTVAPGTPGKVTGAAEFSFTYKCARLQIGKELVGFVDGQAQFDDIDESERLKEIMDMSLSGEAIISKKTETFLKDGTVIIWLEWLEPKAPAAKKDREFLTIPELLSPNRKSDLEADPDFTDSDTDD
jgi:hypothetical protein